MILENFKYKIDEDEKELNVLGNFINRDREYLISEDSQGKNYVFYLSDEESFEYIEDEELSEYIISKWNKDTYTPSNDNWDEEEYLVDDADDILEDLQIVEEDNEDDF